MSRPGVTLVVAPATNRGIGRAGAQPWRLSPAQNHVNKVTMGSAMIMGRRTFDSLPKVLPGRRHIVLTRDRNWSAPGAEVAHSVDEALSLAGGEPVSIIGGAEIFELFLPHADRLELTEVRGEVDGDTIMADPRGGGRWHEVAREEHPAEDDPPAFTFITLERA